MEGGLLYLYPSLLVLVLVLVRVLVHNAVLICDDLPGWGCEWWQWWVWVVAVVAL